MFSFVVEKGSFDHEDGTEAMEYSPPRAAHSASPSRASPIQMHLVIGGEPQNQLSDIASFMDVTHSQHHRHQHHHVASHAITHHEYETVERMQGVEQEGPKGPLVVMDGANIAYAYADALSGFNQSGHAEPDARGIQVAAQYFLSMDDIRVLVVIPAPWFRTKPRVGDEAHGMMKIVG
jgi:hypothetical protein